MFSNMKDPNRVIPKLRGNLFSNFLQVILILFILLVMVQTFLSGELADQFSRYIDLLYIPMIVVFLVVPLAIGFVTRWQLSRRWEQLASEFALKVERPNRLAYPTLAGTFRGHRVSVMISSKQRGRSRVFFTNFMIVLNERSSNTLEVKKRSLVSLNRETIGDEEIDKKLSIKTSSNTFLQRILANRRLRQGLLELGERSRSKELVLSKKDLQYIEQGQISNPDYIRAVLTYLVDLANLVERFDRMAF